MLRKACFHDKKSQLAKLHRCKSHAFRDTTSPAVMKTIFLENYAIYTLPQNNMPENSGSPFPAPCLFLKEGILLSYPSSNKGKSKNIGICVEKVNGSNARKKRPFEIAFIYQNGKKTQLSCHLIDD